MSNRYKMIGIKKKANIFVMVAFKGFVHLEAAVLCRAERHRLRFVLSCAAERVCVLCPMSMLVVKENPGWSGKHGRLVCFVAAAQPVDSECFREATCPVIGGPLPWVPSFKSAGKHIVPRRHDSEVTLL